MPRDAFEGYDEPVNIDMDPEEALKIVLTVEVDRGTTPTEEQDQE